MPVTKDTKLTNQSAYELAGIHLLEQGYRSFDLNASRCTYRNPDGAKCAVGALIPDELYDSQIEEHTIITVMHENREISLFFLHVDLMLLSSLQITHDNYLPNQWKEQLIAVGQQYNLDTSVIENFTKE